MNSSFSWSCQLTGPKTPKILPSDLHGVRSHLTPMVMYQMRKTCRVPRKIPGCRWQARSNTFIQSFTTRIIPFITRAITFLTTILLCTIKFSDGFSNVSTLAGDWVTMKFCLKGELAQAAFVCLKRTLLWLVFHGFSWVSPSKTEIIKMDVYYCYLLFNRHKLGFSHQNHRIGGLTCFYRPKMIFFCGILVRNKANTISNTPKRTFMLWGTIWSMWGYWKW